MFTISERIPQSSRAVDFGVVIPARYGASRLPGKPLRPIAGRPMIVHVLERAWESGASFVIVATDDERIARAVVSAGGEAMLTSPEHPSGTDRIAEVARRLELGPDRIVVNVQGDEPLMDPSNVRLVARALGAEHDAAMSTLALPIRTARELVDRNVVKVVIDDRGFALYFSRSPIPWVRDELDAALRMDELPPGTRFWRHVGIYGYRVGVLHELTAQPSGALERAEKLEQLRALALGLRIHVSQVERAAMPSVDTESDLREVEQVMLARREQPALRVESAT